MPSWNFQSRRRVGPENSFLFLIPPESVRFLPLRFRFWAWFDTSLVGRSPDRERARRMWGFGRSRSESYGETKPQHSTKQSAKDEVLIKNRLFWRLTLTQKSRVFFYGSRLWNKWLSKYCINPTRKLGLVLLSTRIIALPPSPVKAA